MRKVKTKITIAQPRVWQVSAKSKIYSPRQGYLSPGNSIILEIAATLLFIGVTIFCWFWGSFCWNSSTLPTDLFIFVNLSCLQSNTKNILPYHISTLSSKIQYTTWYYNSQRQKISQNPFPAKHLIETNNIRGCLHDTGTSFILVRVVNFMPRLHGRHKYWHRDDAWTKTIMASNEVLLLEIQRMRQ